MLALIVRVWQLLFPSITKMEQGAQWNDVCQA
jgi:hypothetical protein